MEQLRRIAFLLERAGEPTYRVRAFRRAAATSAELDPAELALRGREGTLRRLEGVGETTAAVIEAALAGRTADYLARWEPTADRPVAGEGAGPMGALRAHVRGDAHLHSDWSDGGSPPLEMAETARELGHEWAVLTDHSPRLTVAHGLSAERLRAQLDLVSEISARLAPFRLLTGIEVDILPDGSLDQEPELLARLDVVVGSVHNELRMAAPLMTRRLVTALANPHLDVLGHCTGRLVTGRGRPPSQFDAELVMEAARRFGVAVEVNCRPERRDPPGPLLDAALLAGCLLAVDTDAHAPGQLDWQPYGLERLAARKVDPERILTCWPAQRLLDWTGRSR